MQETRFMPSRSTVGSEARAGSTLLIVMVLLGILSLVGFLFFSFAALERSSATYFADAHKTFSPEIDPTTIMDFALEQILVGPDASLSQSAFAGGRHSLLANAFGRDIHPYNSNGIRLSSQLNGDPFVDMDGNVLPDSSGGSTPHGQDLLQCNDSAVANNSGASARDLTTWPDPGVDYTYPDHNNLFLAYKGYAIDQNGNPVLVIIPSFHRPQLLRSGGTPIANWYQNATTQARVLRPHPSHLNPNGTARFPTAPVGSLTSVFPFMQGAAGYQGVWSRTSPTDTTNYPWEYDVDNDADGIKEGIWLDVNYPVQTTSTGQKFVPLVSVTIYDADALFNLNVHSNLIGLANTGSTSVGHVGNSSQPMISRSNQGHGPAEVNMGMSLNSTPDSTDFTGSGAQLTAALEPLVNMYGSTPTTALEVSNMELYRLLVGSANLTSPSGIIDLFPGRYGESSQLYNAFVQGIANGGNVAATLLTQMPFPGQTGVDDNWNRYEGMFAWEANSGMPGITQPSTYVLQYNLNTPQFYPATFSYYASYPFGTPMDFKGNGTIAQTGTFGKTRRSTTYSRMKYPVFVEYDNPGGVTTVTPAGTSDETNLGSVDTGWRPDSMNGTQMQDRSGNPLLSITFSGPVAALQTDEDAETVADPAEASPYDSIYQYNEIAGLHLSRNDRIRQSVVSRARLQAPFNLGASRRADDNAQQFTSASWDRKQYGYSGNGLTRIWEFSDLYNTAGAPTPDGTPDTFPPQFGSVALYSSADPFRYPVRKLLEMRAGNTTDFTKQQYRLSLNHLTVALSATEIIQRPLTPHEPTLTSAAVSGGQESTARLDRQQLARDIYVLLYTLGGGLDLTTQSGFTGAIGAAGYTGDNSAFNLYNERQLREMAQFAVNMVDAIDPDHVMTKFEYDKNLGDGWSLDDNAYTADGFTAYTASDAEYNADFYEDSPERGIVFGVEAQEMTISEVLAFQSPKIENSSGTAVNHAATEHDDTVARYFTFVELRNISPKTISLAGRQWRLRSVPQDKNGVAGKQRYVTFTGGTIGAGSLLTIGNAGEKDAATITAPEKSLFRCDNSRFTAAFDANDPNAFIAPSTASLNLDLVADRDQTNTYKFRLTDPTLASATVTTDTNVTDDVDITNTTGGNEQPGAFLNEDTIVNATMLGDERPTFILERRQYPDRPAPTFQDQAEENDNPWVPVDRFTLTGGLTQFGLQESDNSRTTYDTRLTALKSVERNEPLVRPTASNSALGITYNPGTSTMGIVSNSLTQENSASSPTFTNWQIIFDRPFASPVELFHIPLYGPQYVTKWTNEGTLPPALQTEDLANEYTTLASVSAQNALPYAATASGKILQPEDHNNRNAAAGAKVPAHDNRWYRLFEFVEVPTRTHRQLGNPLTNVRVPGRLNLNLIRHPAVLAGLLNDTDVMNFANASTSRPTLYATDGGDTDANMPANLRDWWVQFLQARDGRRVFNSADADANGNLISRNRPDAVTGLYLPGLADSNPFRSFSAFGYSRNPGSNIASPENTVDQTLFRRLPLDLSTQPATATLTDKRHLWEVGNVTDHTGGGVDAVMRHRLLSRIYNNSTTRSHVFYAFMTVQLFEADDANGPNNVRIGGPITTIPAYRAFFVLDRSKPEEAFDTTTNTFRNFRAMIKYRLPLD